MSTLEHTIRAIVADELRRLLDDDPETGRAAPPARPQAQPANPAPDVPEAMTADEVAAFLGVDRKTVYDYANRGKIPSQRLGKRLLFSRAQVVAWLRGCESSSVQKGT